jgi:hypothetical protein
MGVLSGRPMEFDLGRGRGLLIDSAQVAAFVAAHCVGAGAAFRRQTTPLLKRLVSVSHSQATRGLAR